MFNHIMALPRVAPSLSLNTTPSYPLPLHAENIDVAEVDETEDADDGVAMEDGERGECTAIRIATHIESSSARISRASFPLSHHSSLS